MLTWDLAEYYGIAPRLRGKQLPHGYATVAHNVDLTHGNLQPFREPLLVKAVKNAIRIYSYGCDIFTFESCVSVAEWIPDCPRLFVTGRTNYPEVGLINNGRLAYQRLGVPQPTTPPQVQPIYMDTDKTREVAYVVTFVNNLGEESAPSLPSIDIAIEDETPVEILLNYNPSIEYRVEKIRLYRRETGFNTGAEKEENLSTNWFLVAELPIDTASYRDTLSIENVGYTLTTMETREPPANMLNITAIEETAVLMGSVQNKLLFSENLQPYNFPLSQEMTLDDNIVALGSLGNSIFVATDGYPYRIEAATGCDKRECRSVMKYDTPLPMIACHTGKGSIMTPLGMVYVSVDGLVLLSERMQPHVISTDIFSADDWHKLQPHTMRLGYNKGALFVVSEVISFILWLDSDIYHDTKYKKCVTISDEPLDMVQTRQGELLMLKDDGVYQWGAGKKYRPYKWVSEPIGNSFRYPLTRVRTKVADALVTCSLECEWGKVSRIFAPGNTIIPFSRLARHREYYIKYEGIGVVSETEIGVSNLDMGVQG